VTLLLGLDVGTTSCKAAVVTPDGAELAHAAKAFVAERGMELAQNCFQVFGGIGYTWDHDAHLHLKRLLTLEHVLGGAPDHLAELATLVIDRP
jgi:alkylation response protein AidB-like acyl-CoA dehydrogenase